MSNFDLLEWAQYLKIPLKNVLSRDQKVPHIHQLGLFIYNLEPAYLFGSHWVATSVRDKVINYFDSFGMPPFQEMADHAKGKNLTLLHQNSQIQNSAKGLILEVHLEYPEELHHFHNDYPSTPEKISVQKEMLSDYCREILEREKMSTGGVRKLIPTLMRREKYVLHYRNLQLYLSLGLKLKKIH